MDGSHHKDAWGSLHICSPWNYEAHYGDLTCFMMWINVAVKTNQRRKQDKTRSTQKKMQEPEVPAFYFICLGVPPPPPPPTTDEGQWPGGGCLTSFSFCTCPLYFTWVFLSYLMPSHFIGIFSLGPSILFYFFRGSTPPWQQTRLMLQTKKLRSKSWKTRVFFTFRLPILAGAFTNRCLPYCFLQCFLKASVKTYQKQEVLAE